MKTKHLTALIGYPIHKETPTMRTRTRNEPMNQDDANHLTQIRQHLNQLLADAEFSNKHLECQVEDLLSTALDELDDLFDL